MTTGIKPAYRLSRAANVQGSDVPLCLLPGVPNISSVVLLIRVPVCLTSRRSRSLFCRPSYVEGRLRLAEKERIRARAKADAAAATGGDGTGGGVSRAAALAEAAAQADANMMALLEEESKLQVSLLQDPQRPPARRYTRTTVQRPT